MSVSQHCWALGADLCRALVDEQVVLVDGVLAALRKAGDSAGTAKEAKETESDNSI
eukprot:COSAG02_NODE_26216_length_638_cov_0.866419_2_plen_55_part_01